MKLIIISIILIYLYTFPSLAQTGLQNKGNIHIHKNAEMSVFCDIVNDSHFEGENGSILRISNNSKPIYISGSEAMNVSDIEIDLESDLYLDNSINISSNLKFINGKIVCSREKNNIGINFLNFSSSSGSNDNKYIDGYASYKGMQEFTLPIGDQGQLKSVIYPIQVQNNYFQSVFFYHDSETTLETDYVPIHSEKALNIKNISTEEFWIVDAEYETSIKLNWNSESNIYKLVDNIEDLVVIGWNIENRKWDNLGNTSTTGDMEKGIISSISFHTKKYSLITLGSQYQEIIPNTNSFGVSTNNDGLNDTLFIQEAIDHPDNEIHIYDRWGIRIYSQKNYKNDFAGSSKDVRFGQGKGMLPQGTYYFVLRLNDINVIKKGYLYINY